MPANSFTVLEMDPKLDSIRRSFPHTESSIYVNHAALGPMSSVVREALHRYIDERHKTEIENFEKVMPIWEETLVQIANMLSASSDNVAFMPNTSYGLNMLAQGLDWNRGDRILIPDCEFPANVNPFLNLSSKGVRVDFIPTVEGAFSVEDLDKCLQPGTRLVSVSWVQFLSGFKADLNAIGAWCKERGILFSVDAIQGLGALQLDVHKSNIDFLACGGHKWLMGAQGIGFIYVSSDLLGRLSMPVAGWLSGPVDWDRLTDFQLAFHPSARRYRLGTLNVMGILALNASLRYYHDTGPDWCENQVLALNRFLGNGLVEAGYHLYGTSEVDARSGIVSCMHPDAAGLFAYLKSQGVRAALRNGLLRFSPTYYNTTEELNTILESMATYNRLSIKTA